MIFVSKMIYDPTTDRAWDNKVGLTIGLTLHTPKFWDCQKYDFYASQFDEMRRDGLDAETMEHRYLGKWAHRNCKRKHLSYPGYLYWTGPKRRYTFRYMGPTHPREMWWKPFSTWKHSRYTRLLDNGPKYEHPKTELDARSIQLMAENRKEFNDAMAKSRAQMEEYERSRGVIRADR